MAECVLDVTKICDECGACEYCDLDESKICDNCCRCLGEADYRAITVSEIIIPKEGIKLKRKKGASK